MDLITVKQNKSIEKVSHGGRIMKDISHVLFSIGFIGGIVSFIFVAYLDTIRRVNLKPESWYLLGFLTGAFMASFCVAAVMTRC